jgi:hypothetical protein
MEPIQGVSPQVCPCHARPGPTARTASPTLSASVSAQPMRKLAWSRSVRPNRLGLAWAGAPARRCPPGSSHNRGETLLCVDRSCFRGAEPAACVAESLRSFDRSLPLLPVDVHATAIDQRGHPSTSMRRRSTNAATVMPRSHGPDTRWRSSHRTLRRSWMRAASLPPCCWHPPARVTSPTVAVASPHRVAGLVLVGSPQPCRHDLRSLTRSSS